MTGMREKRLSGVLLADDGSEHARAAVKFLCDLPLAKDTPIQVLRAFHSTQATESYLLEAQLQETCEPLRAAGYRPEPDLVLGSPAELIIEQASARGPRLIVLGAKGLRATLGILLGGVAQQVVEYACCPVLIVREPYRGLKRLLLVTDGSAYSDYALDYLAEFPLPGTAEITAMHVMAPPAPVMAPVEPGYLGPPIAPLTSLPAEGDRAREAEARSLLKRTQEKLQSSGCICTTELRQGDAATEIIDLVKTRNIDLIVTGSRGLSPMKAWLLGSVSRKLVHYSNCSVLVVRKPGV